MEKIPVGATVARAYSFAFGQFFRILGIIWLPIAALLAGSFLLRTQSKAFSSALAGGNLSGGATALPWLAIFYIGMLILLVMQMVGITEEVLGVRKGSPYFYFNLRKPVWLAIGSFLLLLVAIIVGSIAVGIVFGLLTAAAVSLAPGGALITIPLFLAIFCATIYGAVRLSFLMIPVVVAENRIGLARAWTLARGNFWRIFIILLAVIGPAILVELVVVFGFLLKDMPPILPAGSSPAQQQAAQAAIQAWSAGLVSRIAGYWYVTYPFFFAFSAVFYGLISGAQAFAYRALMPEDPAAEFS